MTTERDVLREVEAALDVLPSAGFEARVRDRVLTEPMRAPRWTWPAAAVVAATVVLAMMLVPRRQGPDSSAVRPATPSVPTTVETVQAPEPTRPVTEARVAGPRRSGRGGTTATERLASPEVVVPAGQMAAIQRLVDEAARGRVVMAPERLASAAVLQVMALEAAAPIEFDPIRFTPLSPDASPDLWR